MPFSIVCFVVERIGLIIIGLGCLINLLSSGVQLGQVSVEVAADLVANSYANLCAYNDSSRVVHLGYCPDPVPARLAMCMMDEDECMDVEVKKEWFVAFKGQEKERWSKALLATFSNEMVHPNSITDLG